MMDERDYHTYHDHFQMMIEFLRPPDLIVYLRAPVELLLDRIRARSREFERRIPAAYLEQLNDRYEEWVSRFDLCPVLELDAASIRLEYLDGVIQQMQDRLPSLFPLRDSGP
jgi:deoxyadenosine/deoxycytidine kinase